MTAIDKRARTRFIIGFLSPALLIYVGMVLYPLCQALIFSAYRWRGLSPHRTFVGLGNFEKLIHDDVFWLTVKHNLGLFFVAGIFIISLAVLLAHATRGASKSAKIVRSVYLFPQVISLVAIAVLWRFIFNPNGPMNSLLHMNKAWLGDSTWALRSVGIAFIWFAAGFYIMLFAAGIESIPAEVQEAAELDGSTGLHRFWRVTWPLLFSVRRVAIVYLVINVMNVFALVYVMTQGGPDRGSEVMLTYLYEQAFVNSEYGYATAVAVGNFFVIMSLSMAILFLLRRDPTEGRR